MPPNLCRTPPGAQTLRLLKELNARYATGGVLQQGNLEFAADQEDPWRVSKFIIAGHPFIDGNKRTAITYLLYSITGKSVEEIEKDWADIYTALR